MPLAIDLERTALEVTLSLTGLGVLLLVAFWARGRRKSQNINGDRSNGSL